MVSQISGQDLYYQSMLQNAQRYPYANPQLAAQRAAQQQATQQLDSYYNQVTQLQQQTQAQVANGCTDGKDDGKIGFWSGVGRFLKGATVNFVKGALGFDKEGHWSLGRCLKNVAIGAAVAVATVATGGAALAVVGAIGAVTACIGIAKSGIKAAKATTDKEAKDAWEDVGSNTTGFVLSVMGVKAGMKQVNPTGNYSGIKGTGRAFRDLGVKSYETVKNAGTSIVDAYKTGGFKAVGETVSSSTKSALKTAKGRLSDAYGKASSKNKAKAENENYDKQIKELTDKKNAEGISKKEQANLDKQIKQLKAEKARYNDINNVKSFDEAQAKISDAKSKVAELEEAISKETSRARTKVYKRQLKAAKAELKMYEDVTARKVADVRNARAEYEKLNNKATDKITEADLTKIDELYAKLKTAENEFKMPETSANKSLSKVVELEKSQVTKCEADVTKAKSNLQEAKLAAKKYPKTNISDEAIAARNQLGKAESALRTAETNLANAKGNLYYDEAALRASKSSFDNIARAKQFTSGVNGTLAEQYGVSPLAGKKLFGKYTIVPEGTSSVYRYIGASNLVNTNVGISIPQSQTDTYPLVAEGNPFVASPQVPARQGAPTYMDYQMLDYYLKLYG